MTHSLKLAIIALSLFGAQAHAAMTNADHKVDPRRKPAVHAANENQAKSKKAGKGLFAKKIRRAHDLNGDGKLGGKEKKLMKKHLAERKMRRDRRNKDDKK